jgi:hypothetical protein
MLIRILNGLIYAIDYGIDDEDAGFGLGEEDLANGMATRSANSTQVGLYSLIECSTYLLPI